jgi:reductive dehalogenase
LYDPEIIRHREKFRDIKHKLGKPGYSREDFALTNASWYLEDRFAMGHPGATQDGLYAWESLAPLTPIPDRIDVSNPANLTSKVKRAARYFGASLVGVCELNRLWVYSHITNDITGEHKTIEIPENYRFAIAIAVEMDYALIKTSPTNGASAATGLAYSKMALVAGLLAQFIRGLGYQAIPCGNDTALSLPIAVEAGLGELGRNGLLITEKFGPRVRLCKVFTDLPLLPDTPHFFGVQEFCQTCMVCAQDCPSQAISFGRRTVEAPTRSNNPGVLKWPIDPEQCYRFWGANRTDCSNCIRVCPYNQKAGLLHDLVRALSRRAPQLNPLFIRFHALFGYDRQAVPESVWD